MNLSKETKAKIFEAIGAASMCWNPKPSDQLFDSTLAQSIGDELIQLIESQPERSIELPSDEEIIGVCCKEIAIVNPSPEVQISIKGLQFFRGAQWLRSEVEKQLK